MQILLIGSGGREHALARAIFLSESSKKLWAAPGNPGIFNYAEPAPLDIKNHKEVIVFCKEKNIDLVVIGPEQPLAEGMADVLRTENISVFGPDKAPAQLESSKGFAKDFMKKYNIPTADYQKFTKSQSLEAIKYITEKDHPVVIKADGLAAGKGVIISDNKEQSIMIINEMFTGKFGEASESIVIEDFLKGEEASILAICDGKDFVTLAPSQDHKRIYDGDKGPNTGGMGAYAPAPIVTEELIEKIENEIIKPTLEGLMEDGMEFRGCLYAGLMINGKDVGVVEFNVRFGDPETQAVLSIIEGDFAELLLSAAKGNINKKALLNTSKAFSCCVILASEGYPDSYEKGFPILGIEDAESKGAIIYHAGTKLDEFSLVSWGGRVLGVTALGDTQRTSVSNAYDAVEMIHFENRFYRKDIGVKAFK